VESRGDFMPARVALAYALRETGRGDEAVAVLDEVLRLAPRHDGARRLRESWGR
jgi:cytochrome c-type biogenesis protein CcmH/NrfG